MKIEPLKTDRKLVIILLCFLTFIFGFLQSRTAVTDASSFIARVKSPQENVTEKWESELSKGKKEGKKYVMLYCVDDELRKVYAKLLTADKNGGYISEQKLSADDVSAILRTHETDVAEDLESYEIIVNSAKKKSKKRESRFSLFRLILYESVHLRILNGDV